MKVTVEDLKSFGLYDELPAKLKLLADGQYYVFYYDTIDAESKLKVFADDIAQNINISLYRELNNLRQQGRIPQTQGATVGYFSFDSFESRSGIFYLFLNTYCPKDKVGAFYEWCVSNDTAGDIAISTSAMNNIYDRGSFERVIAFFATDSRISSIMHVYDMVDGYIKSKLGISIYGSYIKRVVQIVPYEGGVLPERNGDIRFMIIGEKAILTDEEQIKLEEAKAMLRSLAYPPDIYRATGWFFNIADGHWRRNISDVGAYIASDNLREIDGAKVYSPPQNPISLSQVNSLFKNTEKIYEMSYAGHISDVIKHPTLFKRYPMLANMPVLFRDNPKVKFGNFYYSANNLGGFMVIDGNGQNVNLVSVMLHESQHAIQKIEGFGKGGNEFLAKFVMSIGGDNVRRVFYNIKALEKCLLNKITAERFGQLKSIVSNLYEGSSETKQLKDMLVGYTVDMNKFRGAIDVFAMYAAFYLTAAKQLTTGDFIDLLYEITVGNIYELTEIINDGLEKAAGLTEKLQNEGYRQEDIQRIFFNAYEDLMGETESRSVQHQMMAESKYANYFYLYGWENSPARKIAVINDEYVEVDTNMLQGAIERINDEYILHFKQSYSVEPFLHELGHFVDDMLCLDGHKELIDAQYGLATTAKSRDEYFVDCFLGYIQDTIIDANIQKDLSMNFDLKRNVAIDELLDSVFNFKDIKGGYLQYMKTLIEETTETA